MNLRQIEFADRSSMDAFSRLRVSEPETLLDGKSLLDANPIDVSDEETTGSGTTSTFNANEASVTIGVAGTTAGKRTRQSIKRAQYNPGKSQLIFITFAMGAATSGIQKRVGYFSDRNGIFFTDDEGTLKLVRRTYVSGAAVDEEISQLNWNRDPMDGGGPSGIDLDAEQTQILVIDFEWLGVGRVRVGFNVDGQTIVAHEFEHANNIDVVYMQSPHLPVRWEIENDGAGAAATLDCICHSVQSEGGQNPIGRTFATISSAKQSGINGTGSNLYALNGLRIATANEEVASIQPTLFTIVGTTANDTFAWEIIMNPTVAGSPSWAAAHANSVSEVSEGGSLNTVTGGRRLAAGVSQSQSPIDIDPRDIASPGFSSSGVAQEIWLCIRPYSNMQAVGGITWREY